MSILKGDIKLMASKVMSDVPEGGGGPTGIEIQDGVSNEVFPDISELDRALGRLNLRQVHMEVHTNNRDTYLGANVVVATPPDDPNVSITLMDTGGTFDTRSLAVSRLEAYLTEGPRMTAYLYGNHIAGQSSLSWYQRNDTVPAIGETLVLVKREGYPNEYRQFVRVTEASATQYTFEDERGTFTRYVVQVNLLMPLLEDFPGFDVTRFDPTTAQVAAGTKLASTVVANAARYRGVTLSEDAVSIGDYTIKGESMFTQLVPSAQIETPLADARTNQTSAAIVPSGDAITTAIYTTWWTSQALYVGGAITPGTLTVSAGEASVTDQGGRLVTGGSDVGTVDYENGVLTLLSDVFGSSAQTFTVEYTPGAAPQGVTRTSGVEVTAEGRALNYVLTVLPPPVPGTLTVSYMAQGRWYVLRDAGDGALRGSESGYGAGQVNFDTGTISVTLGALPDVGSAIIYNWTEPTAARETAEIPLSYGGRCYWPLNSDGNVSVEAGAESFEPGTLAITWNDGTPRSAADDGAGGITGDATGTVQYGAGVIRLIPNELPPPGTLIAVTSNKVATSAGTATISSGNGDLGVADVTPGTVRMTMTVQVKAVVSGSISAISWISGVNSGTINWGSPRQVLVQDDGSGNLFAHIGDTRFQVGTINYSTGLFSLTASPTLPAAAAATVGAYDNIYVTYTVAGVMGQASI